MYKGLVWSVAGALILAAGAYTWSQRQRVVQSVAVPAGVAAPAVGTHASSTEEQEASNMVTLTGPLADYMSRQNPGLTGNGPTGTGLTGTGQRGTLQASTGRSAGDTYKAPYQPAEADRVGDSPVGTSTPILHKTFPVVALVNLPFDIPPHAANPQLKGTYRSFLRAGGSESASDVEFMLMNQQQFTDLLNGRLGDAVFSAEDAHQQEVNFSLPPTYAAPVRYYLLFRNNARDRGKKLVQADFRMDF